MKNTPNSTAYKTNPTAYTPKSIAYTSNSTACTPISTARTPSSTTMLPSTEYTPSSTTMPNFPADSPYDLQIPDHPLQADDVVTFTHRLPTIPSKVPCMNIHVSEVLRQLSRKKPFECINKLESWGVLSFYEEQEELLPAKIIKEVMALSITLGGVVELVGGIGYGQNVSDTREMAARGIVNRLRKLPPFHSDDSYFESGIKDSGVGDLLGNRNKPRGRFNAQEWVTLRDDSTVDGGLGGPPIDENSNGHGTGNYSTVNPDEYLAEAANEVHLVDEGLGGPGFS